MWKIRRILVAVKEPGSRSSAAIAKGADLARATGASLELYHALSEPLQVAAFLSTRAILLAVERKMRDRSLAELERTARRLRARGIEVSTSVEWDFPASRFSVYEGIPGGFGTSGPAEVIEDLSEPLAFVRLMEKAGVDYINVSAGIPAITPEIVRPTKNYPEGVYRHFGWAQAMKKQVRVPVIGSGYTYLRDGKNDLKEPDPGKKSFLYWAEKNLKEGICDLVGIGRQSLADPLFARKILGGKSAEVNYCTACGSCSVLLRNQAQVGCPIYFEYYRKLLKEIQKTKG